MYIASVRNSSGINIAKALSPIVGVQFRNQATVGGSIFGRYGFSDVLTVLLAMDTFVELYNGGTVRLSEFVNRKMDKDLLISVIVRKSNRKINPPDKNRFPGIDMRYCNRCV